jgi:hypothetical protein
MERKRGTDWRGRERKREGKLVFAIQIFIE